MPLRALPSIVLTNSFRIDQGLSDDSVPVSPMVYSSDACIISCTVRPDISLVRVHVLGKQV